MFATCPQTNIKDIEKMFWNCFSTLCFFFAVNNEPEQDPSFNEESERKTKNFTFRELAMATKNFRQECLLGEGGFGRIFKGTLKENGQV